MVKHWHPNFMWYGPAGIGTTRGMKGFEDYHQIPFLVAFPDRGGTTSAISSASATAATP